MEFIDEERFLMDSCPYAISFLSEFLAMAIQMFLGCLGSIYTFQLGPIISTFSFGLGRLACYETFNHISPVHVNPAKSFGFVVLGRMHPLRFVVYVMAQCLGSTVGIAFLAAVMPSDVESVCVNHLHGVTITQGFFMEFSNTMILMIAVAAATDPIVEGNKNTLNLRVAFVVTVLILTMDPYTHAGKNPARSLSPSIIFNDWHEQWIFHAAPFSGATMGALIYRFIFDVKEKYSLHHLLRKPSS